MNFATALKRITAGSRMARDAWGKSGMYVFFVPDHAINVDQRPERNLGFDVQLLRPVEDLRPSVRARNLIEAHDIEYVGDLVQLSESQVLRTTKVGRRTLYEFKGKLTLWGLHFGMEVPGWPPKDIKSLIESLEDVETQPQLHYTSYIALRTADGHISPWSASSADLLASDWGIVHAQAESGRS